MNAYQPALTTLPWFPIIGNHEWVYHPRPGGEFNGDGDRGLHYEIIAWGEAYGLGAESFPVKTPYLATRPPSPSSSSFIGSSRPRRTIRISRSAQSAERLRDQYPEPAAAGAPWAIAAASDSH